MVYLAGIRGSNTGENHSYKCGRDGRGRERVKGEVGSIEAEDEARIASAMI